MTPSPDRTAARPSMADDDKLAREAAALGGSRRASQVAKSSSSVSAGRLGPDRPGRARGRRHRQPSDPRARCARDRRDRAGPPGLVRHRRGETASDAGPRRPPPASQHRRRRCGSAVIGDMMFAAAGARTTAIRRSHPRAATGPINSGAARPAPTRRDQRDAGAPASVTATVSRTTWRRSRRASSGSPVSGETVSIQGNRSPRLQRPGPPLVSTSVAAGAAGGQHSSSVRCAARSVAPLPATRLAPPFRTIAPFAAMR